MITSQRWRTVYTQRRQRLAYGIDPTKNLTTHFTIVIYIICHGKPLLDFVFPGSYFRAESSILSNATIARLERRQ